MGQRPWRVFLSHTSDLREHPADRSFVGAAEAAIIRAGHALTDMAYFVARDSEPADYCVSLVAQADVYVGVIGFRRGAAVRGDQGRSYTELEFDSATELGLPRLVFLIHEDAADQAGPTTDVSQAGLQREFRHRLQDAGVTTVWVRSPGDLELALLHALVELTATARAEAGNGRPHMEGSPSSRGTSSTSATRSRGPDQRRRRGASRACRPRWRA